MPNVCVLLAEGFEEIEAVTIIDVLRRAEVEVTTLGVGGAEVMGAHGIAIRADSLLVDAARDWDAVILPGGLPGATTLRDDPDVQDLIRAQHAAGRRVAAICAAPIALASAGVLTGKRATSYPGFPLDGAEYCDDLVVVDGTVTTSRGPGTAMAFALQLTADLVSPEVADQLRQGMLV